ncbi:ABC transporter permease [Gemmatimonas phototrophica]|uniref:Multidrug ABC transporter substrate-binding protein n=1 Tax=Gemmatimonas phototrophica TaxID=1379270 RepID=A0A143BNM8_9BACT|nr:ABC transporter permease [Gemmatimonas phototrophica]AMW06110.1 multidrug ABC transporter substrate-binding protein [Gemmatimonas phototrophica]
MKSSTLFKVAAQSILKNRMRTALTMLGIVIGVGAVIIMVAIGNGAQAQIERQISSLGTNMIVITAGTTTQGGASQGAGTFNRLRVEDADFLRANAEQLSAISPVIVTRTQIIGGSGNWRTGVNGVSTDYLTIRDWGVASGALFTDDDVRAKRRVVVLGKTVAANLFADDDAVGATVQLGRSPFVVVGVLNAKGQTATGSDQDDVVLVPYTTAQDRLSGFSFVSQILASATSATAVPAAIEEVTQLMRDVHQLNGGNVPDDFTVRDQTAIAAAATSTASVMTGLLAAIASISLLVGGIGIMNIMLVSVTERTREIGIRMAIGARGSDVLTQFLVESVVMSIFGGLGGLALGIGGAAVVGRITGWATSTPLSAAFIAIGFSAAVGVFFGYYPARKAASLNPIQALRYE